MSQRKKILLIGPLNSAGVGGRLEEMKVWANALRLADCNVSVFSMFNAHPYFGSIPVYESIDILTPLSSYPLLRKLLLRVWGSKLFKKLRDNFYFSEKWESFSNKFDHIVLFITDSSRERLIFDSPSLASVFIRFTGTISNFSNLNRDAHRSSVLNRKYIFHDPALLFGFKPAIPTYFVDQTAISEIELLQIPVSTSITTFAMVGLFMEVKQVEEVILKFAQFPELKLLIFGQGELESNYRELITQNKLTNVEIRGFFPSSIMVQMYIEFDALIINSIEETGPMTGVEAMAAGKCIISTDVGAMRGRIINDFWIIDDTNTLSQVLFNLRNTSKEQISVERNRLRNRYITDYSNKAILSHIAQTILVD